jgi:hypothetical protein
MAWPAATVVAVSTQVLYSSETSQLAGAFFDELIQRLTRTFSHRSRTGR